MAADRSAASRSRRLVVRPRVAQGSGLRRRRPDADVPPRRRGPEPAPWEAAGRSPAPLVTKLRLIERCVATAC